MSQGSDDVLPPQTGDDTDRGWGDDDPSPAERYEELRREVPPHHGG
jgi:hypothetical protein